MQDPFVGEIALFAGTFAPQGWALCDGQLLPINRNEALFGVLGTTYGGDGRTTFALPDLRGRAPIHAGQGPGLSRYSPGDSVGVESVVLTESQMPLHNHILQASTADANATEPANASLARNYDGLNLTPLPPIYVSGAEAGSMTQTSPANISLAGGSRSHTNIQPVLAINYIIALNGIYPTRP